MMGKIKQVLQLLVSFVVLLICFYFFFSNRKVDLLYIGIPSSFVASVLLGIFVNLFSIFESKSTITYYIVRIFFLIILFIAIVVIIDGWGNMPYYFPDYVGKTLLD